MVRTQIYLTEAEQKRLRSLARQTGRKRSQLIREAIDRFLREGSGEERLVRLRQARGIWKDRSDLPDFASLRKEWDGR